MNASWPLDALLLLGLQAGAGMGTLRSRVTRGPRRQRPLYSATPEPLEGELILTGADFEAFRAWGKSTLQEWSLPFDLAEPGTLAVRTYQFTAQPMWELIVNGGYPRGRWRVQVALESLP